VTPIGNDNIRNIDYCQYLLSTPSKINKEWREFLIAEYSVKIQLAKSKEDT